MELLLGGNENLHPHRAFVPTPGLGHESAHSNQLESRMKSLPPGLIPLCVAQEGTAKPANVDTKINNRRHTVSDIYPQSAHLELPLRAPTLTGRAPTVSQQRNE